MGLKATYVSWSKDQATKCRETEMVNWKRCRWLRADLHHSVSAFTGHLWLFIIKVLMDNRKRLKEVFAFALVMVPVMVFVIYFNAERQTKHWRSPVYRKSKLHHDPWEAPSPEPHWEDPGPYHVAYPRNYKFITDDTQTCKNTTPFLLLMIPVSPSDLKARSLIRRTWGKEKMVLDKLVETVFVVGLSGENGAQQERLKQESLQYHDLIQSNFQDSYRNLTIKTMVMLEWLSKYCSKVSYILKIDSDVLLHVKNLVELLLNPNTPKQNYMTGLVWWHSPVLRSRFNKFYMPISVFPEPEYPPYPLGFAYVMSMDLPPKILNASLQIKPIFIEDAYLGMCLKHLGISPTNPPDETMFLVNPRHLLSSCSLSKLIATTTTSVSQMNWYYVMIKKGVRC
ncbi:beta-1,3-galactosyltransferase 5 isoform X2 [Austrofundulus limnaeus]|uniref:Hexosyltransferase n=1 Tax=Austrofundulus limnaeus TaxID=52670 RepID=A0A2I4BU39_AUSLI|nr:PREDICTED: beta-1,3-galactosyltransferase 5-like isoform X2 [Austrofundulus limnaeus]